MFKVIVFFAIVSVALCAPEPKPKADPSLYAAAYAAPVAAYAAPFAGAPLAYTAAYSAPVGYVGPAVLNAGYTAYSPYTGSIVVV